MEKIFSIGYGNLSIDEFIDIIRHFNINYIIDIRSKPYSKYNNNYSKAFLSQYLKNNNINYIYLGDILGGIPNNKYYYDSNGKVEYDKLKNDNKYKEGILKVKRDIENDKRMCLMCSESKPEDCHRSKLIGESLYDIGIDIVHILHDKSLVNHSMLRNEILYPQVDMFDNALKSRKSYN